MRTGLSKTGIAKEILRVNPEARNVDIAKMLECSISLIAQAKSDNKTV